MKDDPTDIVPQLRDMQMRKNIAGLRFRAAAEIERLRGLLTRCETILGNMALENEGAIFNRWPISHEPLRSDARNLLPLIKQAKP